MLCTGVLKVPSLLRTDAILKSLSLCDIYQDQDGEQQTLHDITEPDNPCF